MNIVKLGVTLSMLMAVHDYAYAADVRADTMRPPKLKEGSAKAIIALKVLNGSEFMWDEKKNITNPDLPSIFMTLVEINTKKSKFKINGGVFQLSQANDGYLFIKTRAKPTALKAIASVDIGDSNDDPALCYHDNTFSFVPEAGAVNFLGTVDQNDLEEKIDFAIQADKKPSKWVGDFYVGENVKLPNIIPPTEKDVSELKVYLEDNLPKIQGNVLPVLEKTQTSVKRRHATLTGEFTCL